MKICPVCKSRCFDDLKTCYGCMHQFSEEELPVCEWPIEEDLEEDLEEELIMVPDQERINYVLSLNSVEGNSIFRVDLMNICDPIHIDYEGVGVSTHHDGVRITTDKGVTIDLKRISA